MIPNPHPNASNLRHDTTATEYDDATELLLMRADYFVQAGDYEHALECYVTAMNTQPDCIDARVGFGVVYLKQDRLADAEETFRQALSIAPESAKTIIGMALVCYEKGDLAKAFKLLRLSHDMG